MKAIAIILLSLLTTGLFAQKMDLSFTLNTTCIKVADTLQFYASDPTATTWLWDFGDGYTSSLQNPPHVYSDFGYFCVSLMASNACGDSSLTQTIYVQSASCPCDSNYEISNGWIVTGSESLSNQTFGTQNVRIHGDIVVTSGSHLHISSVNLLMHPQSRIIVERGAHLSLIDCIISDLNDCGMWQGIEVWGSSDSASYSGIHGKVELLGAVFIYNAHIAILSGKRNLSCSCDTTQEPFDLAYSGGVVMATGDTFVNNGLDIKFTPKTNTEGSANIIQRNYFVCSTIGDDHYNTSHINPYPNVHNPWAGHANQYQRSEAAILVENTDGFNVNNCIFRNKQIGILSFDSKYNVFESEFKQMVWGIRIQNTITNIDKRHEISDCEFDSIPGVTNSHGAAILINGGRFDFVHDNLFGYQLTSDQDYNNIAIRTNSANSFKIGENQFNNFKTGVIVRNSGLNSSYVGALGPIWEGNQYYQCGTNIRTAGFNPRLKLKCNMCDNPDPSIYGVNFRNVFGFLAQQGGIPPTVMGVNDQRKYGAGNEFEPYQFPDRKYITSINNYNYYHHTDDNTIPTLYPGSAWINRYSLGVNKDDNDIACPSPLGTLPNFSTKNFAEYPYSILDSIDGVNELLSITLNQQLLAVDGNATYELLADLNSGMSSGKLMNKLLNHSPLSDTVLIEFCKEFPLSVGNFKNVMLANLPVSAHVEPWFYARADLLPPGIRSQLISAQAYNANAYCPAATIREIDENNIMREQWQNDIIITLTDTLNNDKATAIALLEKDTAISSQQVLAGTYLLDGDYALANAKLDTLAESTTVLDSWIDLAGFMSDLYASGNTLYDLDSTAIAWLYEQAYACPENHATAYAQSILYLLFRDEFPECDDFNNKTSCHPELVEGRQLASCDATLYTAYPSPAREKVNIPYYVPEGFVYLVIVDAFGHDIAMYELKEGRSELQIDVSGYAEGAYFYGIRTGTGNCLFQKFVIIK